MLAERASPPSLVAVYDAVRYAYYNYGVVLVAGAGNNGGAEWYAWPAQWNEVVGVSQSDVNDQITGSVSYAPGNVEITAPGTSVHTVCKGGTIGLSSGTSMATPMVSGAFMVLRQRFPSETPDQLRDRLRRTAVPISDAIGTARTGAGRIDVYAALTQ